jgi:uncharacterized protein
LVEVSPVFLRSEMLQFRRYIGDRLVTGDARQTMLRLESSDIRPSKSLTEALASMLDGNEEFVLLDAQKEARERIRTAVQQANDAPQNTVLVVNGGPGTGKSVVAINVLSDLVSNGVNARYVSKNGAPRAVYQQNLKKSVKRGRRGDVTALFMGSGQFRDVGSGSFDCLLVDEAHRLAEKSGLYGNLGEHQVKEVIEASKTTVFFVDEDQAVTWSDIGTIAEIERWASRSGARIERIDLATQFRCQGADQFINWIDDSLGIRPHDDVSFLDSPFDFQIMPSVDALMDLVLERNGEANKARVVAGYCWKWVSKRKPSLFDLTFPDSDLQLRWNLASYGSTWIVDPTSVHEVGCIHTCQGLEVDYIGVIIGPDLIARGGVLESRPLARASSDKSLNGYRKARKEDPEAADARADRLIRNTYRTLLSRGQLGCYVYCTDPETREYFEQRLANAGRQEPSA